MKHTLDFKRLSKVLGMMQSGHEGEVLNAARMASEMVLSSGMTWQQVLKLDVIPSNNAAPTHWDEAERLLATVRKKVITPYERKFLLGILGFKSLSENQAKTLASIARKVDISKRH